MVTGTYVHLDPSTHTVFNLAKYKSGSSHKERVLQTDIDNGFFGFFGFYESKSGIAYENAWITRQDIDCFGKEWTVSIQQPQLLEEIIRI